VLRLAGQLAESSPQGQPRTSLRRAGVLAGRSAASGGSESARQPPCDEHSSGIARLADPTRTRFQVLLRDSATRIDPRPGGTVTGPAEALLVAAPAPAGARRLPARGNLAVCPTSRCGWPPCERLLHKQLPLCDLLLLLVKQTFSVSPPTDVTVWAAALCSAAITGGVRARTRCPSQAAPAGLGLAATGAVPVTEGPATKDPVTGGPVTAGPGRRPLPGAPP
jgi:hypothetical protein